MPKNKPFKNIVLSFTVAGVIFISPIIGHAELGDQVLKEGMRHQDIKTLQQPLVYNRLLKQGLRGNDVQELQERLKALGFMNIDNCTTYFGPQTKQALMNFQRSHGLQVDGLAGSETYKALNSSKRKPSANRGGSRNSTHGNNIVDTARTHMGTPYAFGTSNANSFDCSGFTHYVYKQHGINIPRTSVDQARAGIQVNKGNLQAGDLVIFSNTYKAGPSHTGIYIENDDFIHASSSAGVIISNLNSNYYRKHFSYGRRVN